MSKVWFISASAREPEQLGELLNTYPERSRPHTISAREVESTTTLTIG